MNPIPSSRRECPRHVMLLALMEQSDAHFIDAVKENNEHVREDSLITASPISSPRTRSSGMSERRLRAHVIAFNNSSVAVNPDPTILISCSISGVMSPM